jgi:DNA mismatch repair protein MutL
VPDLTELRPTGELSRSLDSVAEAALGYLESEERRSEAEPPVRGLYGPPPGERVGERPSFAVSEGAGRPAGWVPLAQYRDSYIVAQDPDGLVLVDQHAAHERVLFEEYLRQAEDDRVEVQRLMFPVSLELAPQEATLLAEEIEEFRRLGFAVQPFGASTFRVDGVPAVVGGLDPEACLRELLGQASETRSARSGVEQLRLRLVTSAACQAAIKINHPLTTEGMGRLLGDLARTANPTTCPHGRPVLFRISLEEIERGFRRR